MEPQSRTIEEIQQGGVPVSEANLTVGDYVFASQSNEAVPTDPWRVDHIERIDGYGVYFPETGVMPFRYAQKVTDSEGRNVLTTWKEVFP